MKVLVFGENGQVAHELKKALSIVKEKQFVSSQDCNFLHPETVIKKIRDFKPTHIVNASAYTLVDKAESEPDTAMTVNAKTVGIIAEETKKLDANLIHYSTDYVFDGEKKDAYLEEDQTNPLNIYGKSKQLGESYISSMDVSHVIMRVSWIYGNHGNNFYKSMLRLGSTRDELKIVADQVGAPTWSRNIADVTRQVLSDKNLKEKSGIYHFTDKGEVSWYDFAVKIFEIHKELYPGSFEGLKKILPIKASEYPTPTKRPMNSRMKCDKIKNSFGITQKSWDESLRQVLTEIK